MITDSPRRGQRLVTIGVVAILAVCIALVTYFGRQSGYWMKTGQTGPSSSDVTYLKGCLSEMSSFVWFLKGADTQSPSPNDVNIGSFVQLNNFSDAFYALTATSGLEAEVETVDKWIAPLSYAGEVRGALNVNLDSTDGTYFCESIMEPEVGQAILGMHSGDRLIWEPTSDAHVILRDSDVTPIDDRAKQIVASAALIEDFQTALHEYVSAH